MNTSGRYRLVAVAGAATLLLLGACGDDDDGGGDATATTAAADDGGESPEVSDEYCALAEEMSATDDFPTEEQLDRYRELAPDDVADAVSVAADALLPVADGTESEQIAVFAVDEVSEAIATIDAFETAACGIDHSEDGAPTGDEEAAEGAAEVDVIATDYAFELPARVAAGPIALVMRNEGEEAHFMVLFKVLEGTLEEAMQFEGDAVEEGLMQDVGASGLAAPGGEDTEVLNAELDAGTYGLVCFVPTDDGTPHVAVGMAQEFTVE